jgi:hypothetical protein
MSIPAGVKTPNQTGRDVVQMPRMSPEVMRMWQELSSSIGPGVKQSLGDISTMAKGGTPEYWQQLEAPAKRDFGAIQGNIAARYGHAGALKSSGFQNVMSGQARGLAESLQAQRLNLQQSARDQLLNLYTQLMGNDPYEMALVEKQKKPNYFNKIMQAGLPIAGGIAGGIFGGPSGAVMGADLGNTFGQYFA